MPTTDDVIRVRKSTVGVIRKFLDNYQIFNKFNLSSEYEFIVSDCNFKITDVGGERAERENWIDFLAVKV